MVGLGENCDDWGLDVGRGGMVEQDVVEHGVVGLGGVSKVGVGVEVEGVQRVSMHWLLDLPPSFLPWLALI